ncbi:MAG: hypothetical protein H6719_27850 [Sandaracinaceae bacterium]|nr:hypothetical protein [Sandaracinaceae bacterium]
MTRLLLAMLLLSGCARNGIFELEVDLPPQPPTVAPLFAVVQVSNSLAFDADWTSLERIDGLALRPTCARPLVPPACDVRSLAPDCSEVVSVVGEGDDLARPLRVRVRFCEDAGCTAARDVTAPEARVEFERALYAGHYTQGRVCVDAVPTTPTPTPTIVDRCEVRCRDGEAAMHCRADGTHFCEDP